MTITMNDSHIVSIAQVREFIKVARGITFKGRDKKGKYEWIESVLLRFRYHSLRKKEKSILKAYILQMTGYSDAQLTRLISKKKKFGVIRQSTTARHRFPRTYTPGDIARIIEKLIKIMKGYPGLQRRRYSNESTTNSATQGMSG